MIDADEVTKALKGIVADFITDPAYEIAVGRAYSIVDSAPTIPASQWVSVEDEKPDIGQYVLVYLKDGIMQCAQYSRSGYDDRDLGNLDYYNKGQGEITNWMPLPEPPKEVQERAETA